MGKAIVKLYWALRGTREGGYSRVPVGVTTKFIRCHAVFHVSIFWKYAADPTHVVD